MLQSGIYLFCSWLHQDPEFIYFYDTVWGKFFEDTGGEEQNIVHKQGGKDRSTRNYTIKIWEGTPFCIFASKGDGDALKLRGTSKITDGN